jgi:hypothetical protein
VTNVFNYHLALENIPSPLGARKHSIANHVVIKKISIIARLAIETF